MAEICITAGSVTLSGDLNDSPTAKIIWEGLPFVGHANVWGDEIYFEIPVVVEQEADARQDVDVGELGYWPSGQAFCIFFGPTPASVDERPRAYSPVNVIGRVSGDVSLLCQVPDGAHVRVVKVGD